MQSAIQYLGNQQMFYCLGCGARREVTTSTVRNPDAFLAKKERFQIEHEDCTLRMNGMKRDEKHLPAGLAAHGLRCS